jgi:hypothetical protein
MKHCIYILLLFLAFSCKTPYQQKLNATTNSYLVIEGTINSNNGPADSTLVTLSRTIDISTANKTTAELRAIVSVEDGNGYVFALREIPGGRYVSGPLGLDKTKKYRLRVKTTENKTYLSDLESIVYTPPIDSIGFTTSGQRVTIYANAHNPNNNTWYYRWDYQETWTIHAPYKSMFMTNGQAIVPRPDNAQFPSKCWIGDNSNDIALASTKKLVNDVVYQAPIAYIDGVSEKLSDRYSILLKQYGLSEDAFRFWQQLQKNTEKIGSIFDAQPSEIKGNIHCITNAAEQVFGYISFTNIQTKRIYINPIDLPVSYFVGIKTICELDSIPFIPPRPDDPHVSVTLVPFGSVLIPINEIFIGPAISPWGYTAVTQSCVDCTIRGSKVRPSFWKDF